GRWEGRGGGGGGVGGGGAAGRHVRDRLWPRVEAGSPNDCGWPRDHPARTAAQTRKNRLISRRYERSLACCRVLRCATLARLDAVLRLLQGSGARARPRL